MVSKENQIICQDSYIVSPILIMNEPKNNIRDKTHIPTVLLSCCCLLLRENETFEVLKCHADFIFNSPKLRSPSSKFSTHQLFQGRELGKRKNKQHR